MKTLIFEGAGMEGADSSILSGVGNCRIRTRIRNNNGRVIYLEMGGIIFDKKSKYTPEYAKPFDFFGSVDFCFYDDAKWDARRNYSKELKEIERKYFEYNKETILKFVNDNLNCSFDKIEVINDNSVLVHDTKEPLCNCSKENYTPYEDIEININVLNDIKPILNFKDRGLAQYKISYRFVKKIMRKWMEERSEEEQKQFKKFNYYVSIRWGNDNIINSLEISARQNFCCMGLSAEDLQNVIDEIKKVNK